MLLDRDQSNWLLLISGILFNEKVVYFSINIYIQKGDYKKALEIIDDGLKFHEYDKDLYQLRLKIHKNQNQLDLEGIDLKKINAIDEDLMIDIWVTVIGIPRR